MLRRTFVASTGLVALAQTSATMKPRNKIGIDLFSIRSSGYTPFEYLDYAAKQGANVVHFSEIRFIGNLEPDHLRKVRAYAEKLGVELELGMRSICPTSKAFDATQGTAEQQIERMLVSAKLVGSPIVRCFLGTSNDRVGAMPIEGHIENTVKVLRNVRSKVVDAGLKIAIENHAGDMQGRELKSLVEGAGKDFVGVCLDSGNPLWVLEDPHVTLETLAPYVVTSHVRDTAVWRVPEGAAVQWVRMGEGNIGIDSYVKRYVELCPGKPITLEIIVTGARKYPYFDAKFWEGYQNIRASEFARFVALVDKGEPRPATPPVPKEHAPQREREDLEASFRWVQNFVAKLA
ncbi:MAG TPA: TIM barrel protein [Bryobacteraceae bacterium]|nr:TIM barrel protein [Bryobacteraceae bacterium]